MILAETCAGFTAEFESVRAYEQSWMWRNTRRRYRAMGGPRECFICASRRIDLHHRSYAHIGHEALDELVPLCEDHHAMVEILVRGGWASRWDAHTILKARLEQRVGGDLRRLSELAA